MPLHECNSFKMDGTPQKKSSPIWDFFTIVPDQPQWAKCNQCKGLISRGGKDKSKQTTSNLISHLEKKHANLHAEYIQKKDAILKASSTPSTPKHLASPKVLFSSPKTAFNFGFAQPIKKGSKRYNDLTQ